MALLSDTEIQSRLSELSGWEKEGDAIAKRYDFPNFVAAIAFVDRVAERAESARHPDITIHYNKVTLKFSTHSEGGVTENDINAAKSFEEAVG